MSESNDKQLRQDVIDELTWDPRVTEAQIGVTANAGVITLLGHVDSFAERFAAEAAARRVKGVRAVAEELEVRLPFTIERGDEDIARAALERFSLDVSIPKDVIKLKVERGWVTPTGEVEWHFQKDTAVQAVRGLSGVIGMSDEITIETQLDASNISRDIMRALHRSWFDHKTIKVTAEGGKVHLNGTAASRHDRDVVESTAWAAPGATAVKNSISII